MSRSVETLELEELPLEDWSLFDPLPPDEPEDEPTLVYLGRPAARWKRGASFEALPCGRPTWLTHEATPEKAPLPPKKTRERKLKEYVSDWAVLHPPDLEQEVIDAERRAEEAVAISARLWDEVKRTIVDLSCSICRQPIPRDRPPNITRRGIACDACTPDADNDGPEEPTIIPSCTRCGRLRSEVIWKGRLDQSPPELRNRLDYEPSYFYRGADIITRRFPCHDGMTHQWC